MKKERPWRRSNTSEFVAKAMTHPKHIGKYDYSLVDYKFNDVKVDIICGEHGVFSITPANHLTGMGCAKCGDAANGISQRKTTEEFIRESVDYWGDSYDYSQVHYVTGKTKVKIICKTHGVFEKLPIKHINGQGCPSCAKSGFKVHSPASLYILECGEITKIGVTNRKITERVRTIRKSSGTPFKIAAEFNFDLGKHAIAIETILLNEISQTHQQPQDVFDGSTECFLDLDKSYLIKRIVELISEIIKEQNSSNNQAAQAA